MYTIYSSSKANGNRLNGNICSSLISWLSWIFKRLVDNSLIIFGWRFYVSNYSFASTSFFHFVKRYHKIFSSFFSFLMQTSWSKFRFLQVLLRLLNWFWRVNLRNPLNNVLLLLNLFLHRLPPT